MKSVSELTQVETTPSKKRGQESPHVRESSITLGAIIISFLCLVLLFRQRNSRQASPSEVRKEHNLHQRTSFKKDKLNVADAYEVTKQ